MPAKSNDTEDQLTPEERKAARTELADKIVQAREEGQKWEDIASTFGTSTGRAMLLHMEATVRPKDRIKAATDDELSVKIAAARNEDRLSWGQIMARTGLSETRCRNLYEKATGNSTRGNRIGKGGRYPDGVTPPDRAGEDTDAAVKKAAASKKQTTARKAAEASEDRLSQSAAKIAGLNDLKEIAAAVVGKNITYKSGGAQKRVKVADLLDFTGEGDGAELMVSDAEENEYVIVVSSILKVAAR